MKMKKDQGEEHRWNFTYQYRVTSVNELVAECGLFVASKAPATNTKIVCYVLQHLKYVNELGTHGSLQLGLVMPERIK